MTLEEAIKHCEEEAERIERNYPYIDASEYRQLTEWLKELKMFKDLEAQGYAMYKVSEVMQNDT